MVYAIWDGFTCWWSPTDSDLQCALQLVACETPRNAKRVTFSPGEMRCRVVVNFRDQSPWWNLLLKIIGIWLWWPSGILRPFFQMADWWFMVSICIYVYDDLAIKKWCFPGKLLVLPESITGTKRFCVVQQPRPKHRSCRHHVLFGSCQCQNDHPKISGMDFFHIIHTLHPLITLLQEFFLGFATKKTPKRVNKNL